MQFTNGNSNEVGILNHVFFAEQTNGHLLETNQFFKTKNKKSIGKVTSL